MTLKIALIGMASLFVVSIASAQSVPPPGNVSPGLTKSGAEQTGAPNQPRSKGADKGTKATKAKGGKPGSAQSSPESTAGGAIGTSKDGKK